VSPALSSLPECRLLGLRLRAGEVLDHIFGEPAQGRGGWSVTNLDFLRRYHRDPAARWRGPPLASTGRPS
jgi:hypothetical protein